MERYLILNVTAGVVKENSWITLDQLLGYSSWRDTKVAVIVFNRNKDFSKVLKTIEETIRISLIGNAILALNRKPIFVISSPIEMTLVVK